MIPTTFPKWFRNRMRKQMGPKNRNTRKQRKGNFWEVFCRREKRRKAAKKENGSLRILATFPHPVGGRSATDDCLSPPAGPPVLAISAEPPSRSHLKMFGLCFFSFIEGNVAKQWQVSLVKTRTSCSSVPKQDRECRSKVIFDKEIVI